MNTYEEALIVKAAWYYYIENMTQQIISDKLGISRMKVIKLLEKARQDGVIQFKISEKHSQLMVEQKLTEKWGLKEVYVVPTPPSPSLVNDTIARAAAMYLHSRLSENMFLNMGYGDTLCKLLNYLAKMAEFPINVVSMTGGVSYYLPNAQSNIFNAKLYLFPTPLLVSSKEMCDAMWQEPSVQMINKIIPLSTFSVVSIGAMNDEATILKNGILNRESFLLLSMKGAVGDILTQFIDKNGKPINSEIESRLMSVKLSQLQELNNVVGVAGGAPKIDAIKAALKSGYLDIFITDEDTATELIKD